jgi:methylmalonyl-CoA/ethylmalonyl-CoA epimerase
MLKVPSLGQVGIVIEDIERTMRHYEDVLGIGPWAVFEGEPERCINLGKEVSFKGKMAMARAGTVQIELIEIIEGESIHRDFLATHGEGIHHLGFFVRDLEERVRAAQRAGISVLQRGTLRQLGLCIEYAYLDTTGTGGVIVEFIEARFMGLPFPMRSPLLRLGAGLANRLQR